MILSYLPGLLMLGVICCALVSGIFLTFSDFVMRSLKLAKTEAGIEAMQQINREVYRSVFMILLWAMVLLSVVLVVMTYLYLDGWMRILVAGGALSYFIGVLVVSFVFNIPMNHRLEAMSCSDPDAAIYWLDHYQPRWVFWNWVRAFSSGLAAISFLLASSIS